MGTQTQGLMSLWDLVCGKSCSSHFESILNMECIKTHCWCNRVMCVLCCYSNGKNLFQKNEDCKKWAGALRVFFQVILTNEKSNSFISLTMNSYLNTLYCICYWIPLATHFKNLKLKSGWLGTFISYWVILGDFLYWVEFSSHSFWTN